MTLIYSALAGGDCIEDADRMRVAATTEVLGHGVRAPSTLGTFLTRLTCGTRDSQHSDPAWQPRRDDSTSGSRWSARSVARTNDLEADRGRRDDETVPER